MCTGDMHIFNVSTCKWTEVACYSGHFIRMQHCVIPIEDKICIVGGAILSEGNMLQQNCDVLEVWLQEDDQLVFRPVGSIVLVQFKFCSLTNTRGSKIKATLVPCLRLLRSTDRAGVESC